MNKPKAVAVVGTITTAIACLVIPFRDRNEQLIIKAEKLRDKLEGRGRNLTLQDFKSLQHLIDQLDDQAQDAPGFWAEPLIAARMPLEQIERTFIAQSKVA